MNLYILVVSMFLAFSHHAMDGESTILLEDGSDEDEGKKRSDSKNSDFDPEQEDLSSRSLGFPSSMRNHYSDDDEDNDLASPRAINELETLSLRGQVDSAVMASHLQAIFQESYCIPSFWQGGTYKRIERLAKSHNIPLTFRLTQMPAALKRALKDPEVIAWGGCIVLGTVVGVVVLCTIGSPNPHEETKDHPKTSTYTAAQVFGGIFIGGPILFCTYRMLVTGGCCLKNLFHSRS